MLGYRAICILRVASSSEFCYPKSAWGSKWGTRDSDHAKADRYRTVQHQLLKLREDGVVPWRWVSDGTRWRRQRQSFGCKADAVDYIAQIYRRDLWMRTPAYVEVWCESDSMAGVLIEETNRYNVSLMVSRGFSSRTFLYNAAREIELEDRPAYLYYVGDYDPSGILTPEKIERRSLGSGDHSAQVITKEIPAFRQTKNTLSGHPRGGSSELPRSI